MLKKLIIFFVFSFIVLLTGCQNKNNSIEIVDGDFKYLISESTFEPYTYDISILAGEGECVVPAEVTDSEGNKYTITGIKEEGFSDCHLTKITLSEGIKYIGNHSFFSSLSLEEVILPEGVLYLGDYAFASCEKLQNVVLEEGILRIDQYAFSKCESLESLNIPSTVTEIDNNAFSDCKSLKSIVLPDNLLIIERYAFSNCTSLETITLPEKISFVDVGLFYNCQNLVNVYFSEAISKLCDFSFYNCDKLSLVVNKNIATIEIDAFNSASGNIYSEFSEKPEGYKCETKDFYWYSETMSNGQTTTKYWRYVGGNPTKW